MCAAAPRRRRKRASAAALGEIDTAATHTDFPLSYLQTATAHRHGKERERANWTATHTCYLLQVYTLSAFFS